MVKRIVLFLIAFTIVIICSVALTTPRDISVYTIDDENDTVLQELFLNDVTLFNQCYVDDNNRIIANGGDPYIVFSHLNSNCKSAVLKFGENSLSTSVQLFFDDSSGYNEQNSITNIMTKKYEHCVFPINADKTNGIRIDINKNYRFSSLELHSSPATFKTVKSDISIKSYIMCIIVSLILSTLITIIDKRFCFFEKSLKYIKKHLPTIIKLSLLFICCGLISAIIEYLIANFIIVVIDYTFSLYRFVFIFGVLFSLSLLFAFRKSIAGNPEKAFLCISLTICMAMVIICPFGHASWDIDNHYKWVVNASYFGKTSYITKADIGVESISPAYWPEKDININSDNIRKMNDDYQITIGMRDGTTTVAHVLSGLFLAVGRLFNMTFYEMTTFAKIASALIYCVVCFFAIKKLKSGKMIAVVVSLIPTSLFIATNFSYDYWVNCFVILGMAYFVGVQQDPEKQISLKETLIMCSAFAAASLPKLVYAVFLIIPFFINPKKVKNKKQYYLICVASIAVLFVMLLIQTIFSIKGGGDFRGGAEVNSVGQVKFILSNLMQYSVILAKFLFSYLSVPNMKNYITNFAYLGMGKGAFIFIILMVVTALTDKNKNDIKSYTLLSRFALLAIYVGTSALIATALYISFTPVALNTVLGCQPRYIIPILYPLLSIIGIGFNNKINRTFYNSSVLAICAGVNMYNIFTVMLPYWLA